MVESLGHYKILGGIGAGGMGEVYRARDTRLGRTVAIKVLPDDLVNDADRRERLLREARATAALSHPNIAALYEIGEDQAHRFLVFEYVPGETLKTVIAGRPLNARRAIDLAVEIADALAEAHSEGIVHRDIKPENIIVTPKGHAKILDFGLAKWTASGAGREQAASTMAATGAGAALGTVAYMSPEQALGEPVDHRTDIFSFGIVLFEMLTGKLPFTGSTATAVAVQIVQTAAPVPSSVNRGVPRELDPIVAKALEKSVDARYETAASLAAELRSVGAILDVRSGTIEPADAVVGPAPRRRSYGRWILLLIVLAALGAAAWIERAAIARLLSRTFGSAPPPVIAVIPLDAGDAAQTYFADGLTEDLITRLGQTPGLKVLGRSATRAYRGRSPRDVAGELGAGVVLTGSVRPSGETVKVSLELVDPSDGTAIWSGQYTREVKDIFAVQAQVADEVAQALRVALRPTASSTRARSRLVDRRAYDLYLRGRQAVAERRLPAAIQLFEQATAGDSGLAEAFAGLAEALDLESSFFGLPLDPAREARVRSAAERALRLEPDLPQANLAMGLTADALGTALTHLRHAVDLDPSFAEGFHQIGDQIIDFDPDRAIGFYRRAIALDPKAAIVRADIAVAETVAGRTDAARAALAAPEASQPEVANMSPGFSALLDLYEGRPEPALASLSANPAVHQAQFYWLVYIQALQEGGRAAEAYQEASQLAAKFPSYCEAKAILAGLTVDRGQTAAGRAIAAPILQTAGAPDATGSAVRCGVFAAAALNDISTVAALLQSIAASERLLRYWALNVTGQTGSMTLRGRLYPWTNVAEQPPVVDARKALETAYARERDVAKSVLAGLP